MNNSKSFLSISFKKSYVSPNVPVATFHQGDVSLNFILDSGADENVIDSRALSKIKYQEMEHDGNLIGVGGTYQVKACVIDMQYAKESFSEKFLISDNLKESFEIVERDCEVTLHGILGSQFLRRHSLILDFGTLTAYNNKQ